MNISQKVTPGVKPHIDTNDSALSEKNKNVMTRRGHKSSICAQINHIHKMQHKINKAKFINGKFQQECVVFYKAKYVVLACISYWVRINHTNDKLYHACILNIEQINVRPQTNIQHIQVEERGENIHWQRMQSVGARPLSLLRALERDRGVVGGALNYKRETSRFEHFFERGKKRLST